VDAAQRALLGAHGQLASCAKKDLPANYWREIFKILNLQMSKIISRGQFFLVRSYGGKITPGANPTIFEFTATTPAL
jgi:hypothetical protein